MIKWSCFFFLPQKLYDRPDQVDIVEYVNHIDQEVNTDLVEDSLEFSVKVGFGIEGSIPLEIITITAGLGFK